MGKYKIQILENSGKIVKDLGKLSELNLQASEKVYVVLRDGQAHQDLLKYQDQIYMVSPRFIEYCIDKKMVIKNPNEEKLIHLMPFPIKTPIKNFDKIKIVIKGFNFDKNDSLEQVAQILGFNIVEEERDADVVVLSKAKYEKLSKIAKNQTKPSYQQEKWFLKVLSKGELGSEVEQAVGIKSAH